MTLLPQVAEKPGALPVRNPRGLSQMPWERPAPVPTGPCFWCQTPEARQLLSEPLNYEGSAVYACATTDWAGCRDRKRERDAALAAAAAKAAEEEAKPKPAPKAPRRARTRAERVTQAAHAKTTEPPKADTDG